MATQDERLAAIAAAAADVLRRTPYHAVRAGDVAAAVRLPGERGRSAVWLYNEVRNRRVLVALAAAHAWRDFPGRADWSCPRPIGSVTAARSACVVAALAVIVRVPPGRADADELCRRRHRDIATAGEEALVARLRPDSACLRESPCGPGSRRLLGGLGAHVFTDFLRTGAASVRRVRRIFLLEPYPLARSASRSSYVASARCLADREGPASTWSRAGSWRWRRPRCCTWSLPRDLEGGENLRWRRSPGGGQTAGPRRMQSPSWSGSCSRRLPCTNGCVRRRRTVSLWQGVAAATSTAGSPSKVRRCSRLPGQPGSATPRAISGRPWHGTGESAAGVGCVGVVASFR